MTNEVPARFEFAAEFVDVLRTACSRSSRSRASRARELRSPRTGAGRRRLDVLDISLVVLVAGALASASLVDRSFDCVVNGDVHASAATSLGAVAWL
jgi:hypothetical protein